MVRDETRMKQMLLKLADKASNFTEQGGVAIVVAHGRWPDA
jgi:hypothetical protein